MGQNMYGFGTEPDLILDLGISTRSKSIKQSKPNLGSRPVFFGQSNTLGNRSIGYPLVTLTRAITEALHGRKKKKAKKIKIKNEGLIPYQGQ